MTFEELQLLAAKEYTLLRKQGVIEGFAALGGFLFAAEMQALVGGANLREEFKAIRLVRGQVLQAQPQVVYIPCMSCLEGNRDEEGFCSNRHCGKSLRDDGDLP